MEQATKKTRSALHFRRAVHGIVSLVYPPRCTLCHDDLAEIADEILLCGDCRGQLIPPATGYCLKCGAAQRSDQNVNQCPHCRNAKVHWDRAIALGNYSDALSQAVIQTKSPQHEPLASALSLLLFQHRYEFFANLNLSGVVPIPMHWARRAVRGTNGPEVMALTLAACLKIPLRGRLLRRRRLTPLQSESSQHERQVNQRQSFRVRKSAQISGQRLLLVDDVLTTGATANEAAKILKQAGAASVVVAVIARVGQ
jgi:ComF family protein